MTSCTRRLFIEDNQPPVILEQAQDAVIDCFSDYAAEVQNWINNQGGALANDYCGGQNITWTTVPAVVTPPAIVTEETGPWTQDVMFIVEDACGNKDTTTANVLVICFIPPTLGDFVWLDQDGDGLQDPNEPGVPNVEITVFDAEGNVIGFDITDSNGFWNSGELPIGEYYVQFELPGGYLFTVNDEGTSDNMDSDVGNFNGENTTQSITLFWTEDFMGLDAGVVKCVPIGDRMWYDTNEDGIYQDHESGVNGARINLWRKRLDGSYILWDYTYSGHKPDTPSEDGYFKFCTEPGTYYLEFIDSEESLVAGLPNRGNDDTRDSDVTRRFGPGTTDEFTVMSDDERCDFGAGYIPQVEIGDYAWEDENFNGIQDANEFGLADVYIELYDGNGNMIDATRTDETGHYLFTDLWPLDYYLKAYPPGAYSSTMYTDSNDNMNNDMNHAFGYNTTKMISTSSGDVVMSMDLGFTVDFTVPIAEAGFSGKAFDSYNLLEWEYHGTESNITFNIERKAVNEDHFMDIGNVEMEDGVSQYAFNDASFDHEDNYYRLRIEDSSGNKLYSKTIFIENNNGMAYASVFPNPFNEKLYVNITNENKEPVEFKIYDVLGKLVKEVTEEATTENTYQIDMNGISAGNYILRIDYGSVQLTKRISKI